MFAKFITPIQRSIEYAGGLTCDREVYFKEVFLRVTWFFAHMAVSGLTNESWLKLRRADAL